MSRQLYCPAVCLRYILFVPLLFALLTACATSPVVPDPTRVPAPPSATATRDPGRLAGPDGTAVAAVQTREARVVDALAAPLPILTLGEGLTPDQERAQSLALQNEQFVGESFDIVSGIPLRSEIFGVYPFRDSDKTEATQSCAATGCYRVEKYNYATNQTVVAMVDVTAGMVLDVDVYPETQPDLPPHLTQLAVDIAINAPEVAEALGEMPSASQATMANMKTALNRSICERSRHLCVAPTFLVGDRALWAIVDLTDNRLIGVRWTDWGASHSPPVTEKTLQNDALYAQYCDKTTALARDGWALDYILTSSDGLRISDVRFNGVPVLESAKLVDYHVSYSSVEGFGYSDAIGCPIFSQAAVVALEPPAVEEIVESGQVVGFALTQDFRSEFWPLPCNYRYAQRYEFYADGRFRVLGENLGRGCGNDGTYRMVLRIAPAGPSSIAAWDGSAHVSWTAEQWIRQTSATPPASGEVPYLLETEVERYAVAPVWSDPARSDSAWFYVTRRHPDRDEGDADLITIGPCCNTDYRQGPEKFIEPSPEPLREGQMPTEVVLWYVPELTNDDTPGREYCWADFDIQQGVYTPYAWACGAGLDFVPVGKR